MTPDQAKYFWQTLQDNELIAPCKEPMAAAGLAIALRDTGHYELSDSELVEAGHALGFAVVNEDTPYIRAMINTAEEAGNLAVINADEQFEPFTVTFERTPTGAIEASVSICGVTFEPHVLQGTDIQFAWDYQRVARECLAAQRGTEDA